MDFAMPFPLEVLPLFPSFPPSQGAPKLPHPSRHFPLPSSQAASKLAEEAGLMDLCDVGLFREAEEVRGGRRGEGGLFREAEEVRR